MGAIALRVEPTADRFFLGGSLPNAHSSSFPPPSTLFLKPSASRLGEAFAMDDQIRSERDYFERLLLQHGIDQEGYPFTEEQE